MTGTAPRGVAWPPCLWSRLVRCSALLHWPPLPPLQLLPWQMLLRLPLRQPPSQTPLQRLWPLQAPLQHLRPL